MPNDCLEASGKDNFRLQVEFIRQSDRYRHVISAVDSNGAMVPLLESIEGTAAEDWPPSPPLQTLSIETLPTGRPVALLVGMAGRGHWSASIEPTIGEAKLIFDLACRHGQQPSWLGSRYRWLLPLAERLAIQSENARVTRENDTLIIEPAGNTPPSISTRWLYTVCLNPAP